MKNEKHLKMKSVRSRKKDWANAENKNNKRTERSGMTQNGTEKKNGKNGAARPVKKIADAVYDLVLPVADEQELVIWDVEYVREGGRYVLRITIDREDGVDIDHCEAFHRAIDPVLDAADPISEPYVLEVSSPGIERELKNDFHLSACEGWQVEVKLYAPMNGAKVFRGVLLPCGDGKITIGIGNYDPETGGETLSFERSAVAKVQTYFDFSALS